MSSYFIGKKAEISHNQAGSIKYFLKPAVLSP
jgi:hypothetical protein